MQDIEHSLIGEVGAGLFIEHQKRLTIGVELVSKPKTLIFLDDPTSGLGGQAFQHSQVPAKAIRRRTGHSYDYPSTLSFIICPI
ncbi:uncharacterized protein LY89DRAFT_640508 [Mollisia scopiformis]|uniref:Uncharacterized protein n=1 Tax=Mollisia scopiformis TaxID=149040 RepID=A0A194XKI6_MOLSC|nr:uncharacterized protein LY89DRAFT_640508 [Mollisia scopiformis]KUJ20725.1 hypothetical protein LY89DRAFT_640508 [Mollisia scopiformis]